MTQPPQDPAVTTEFEQAVVLCQQGRVTEAERLCHAVLRSVPEHYQALHLLGVLALARRDVAAGANWIARSLRLNASQPLAYSNLGAALLDLGRSEEALRNLDRALALMPDFPEAVNNRGNALLVLRRVDEALATYERAIALRPDYADALNNRGNALKELGRVGEALAAYEQALRIHPEFPAALVNRGNALSALGRGAEAIAAFEAALRLDASNVDALNGLGTALRALDRPLEALAAYERALQVAPALAKLHYNRGNALLQLQQAEEALASYERALQLDPGDVDALCNRGNALRDLRRLPEALASYEAVLGLDPGNADALSNRGTVLLELKEYEAAAAAFRRLLELAPDYPYAPGHHLQAQLNCCDWSDYAASVARVRAGVAAGRPVIVPFSFLAVADSPAAELSCVRRFVADGFAGPPAAAWRAPPYAHQRLRLAYLSSNFRSHALAYLMAELFERHDRGRFEVIAVSYGADDGSAMRARLQRAFDYFHDVRTLGDAAVAELLRRSEIDIAVDLNGFTTDARTAILARRAAPVQVSYLGFPGTMGGSQIDYLIADRHVIPPAERVHYAEQVVYLPDCYFVHPAEREVAERSPSRRESGLPDNGFVFCCFNNNYKIAPPVFRV
jgi:predicted O-linked N-acetylglucosamine transferase (SPINDLY family)